MITDILARTTTLPADMILITTVMAANLLATASLAYTTVAPVMAEATPTATMVTMKVATAVTLTDTIATLVISMDLLRMATRADLNQRTLMSMAATSRTDSTMMMRRTTGARTKTAECLTDMVSHKDITRAQEGIAATK